MSEEGRKSGGPAMELRRRMLSKLREKGIKPLQVVLGNHLCGLVPRSEIVAWRKILAEEKK